MKKILFLFLISLLAASMAAAQSTNDLFEKIDPYQKQPGTNPQQQVPQQPQAYGNPAQQQVAPAYPGYPQAQQQGYQPPQTYPVYQPPAPANPDAVKVFGNGFDFKSLYPGQVQQQPGYSEQPAWQDLSTIDPGKEEKNYESRLKEGIEKPLPKRATTIGDDRIGELRDRVNALAVPKAKK